MRPVELQEDFNLDYQPNVKQDKALECLANDSEFNEVYYGGPKGGGKSDLGRTWVMVRCLMWPKSLGLIIRKHRKDLYQNHIAILMQKFPFLNYNQKESQLELPNGSRIVLGYYQTDDDLDQYQGVEFHSIFIDQAEQMDKAIITRLRSCRRSAIPSLRPKMLVTFNWGGPGHAYLVRLCVNREPDEREDLSKTTFIKASVYDNPHINKEYVDELNSLPNQLKRAYLDGDHTAFEGQFFAVTGLSRVNEYYHIAESDCAENLFGSLDHGITHNTSFGFWYLRKDGTMHRLFQYRNNGSTARDHAVEIKNRIEAFRWTWGHMPIRIYADPSMWTKQRLNENMTRSVIDEYIEVFAGTKVQFVKANNEKESGCAIMRQVFATHDGEPLFYYWSDYNKGLVEDLQSMVADENHPEQYLKVDGDDTVDECRYGIVGNWTEISNRKSVRHTQAKSSEYNRRRSQMNWMTA